MLNVDVVDRSDGSWDNRHIIVRFLWDKAKAAVLKAAREKKQITWNGTRIFFLPRPRAGDSREMQ